MPRFVAGVAAMPAGVRCRRCQGPLEPATEARAFEETQPLCDVCALEHAPPFIVRSLLAEGSARLDRQTRPDYLERLAAPEVVERAYLDELSASEAETLLWALHGLFPAALDTIVEQVGERERERLLAAGERWPQADDEDDVLETLDAALRLSPVEKLRAAEVWATFEGKPFEQQLGELRALEPRFRTPALYHRLAEESQRLLREVPRRARELAELAREALAALDPELLGEEALADLEADAWARLGNARRVTCDLAGADTALETALGCYRRGSRLWRRKAEILDFQGSLRRDQRRFDEAHACLDRALAIYRACEQPELVAKVLIKKATVCRHSCAPKQAIGLLRKALALIDEETQPQLFSAASHNLLVYLCECERCDEAEILLPAVAACHQKHDHAAARLRMLWLRGKIACGLNRLEEGEALLLEAQQACIDVEDVCGAGLITLELITFYFRQNRLADLPKLAISILPIFGMRSIQRETLAAFEALRQSLLAGSVQPKALSELEEHLNSTAYRPAMAPVPLDLFQK